MNLPGDLLVRPVPLAALVVLVVNDHLLKRFVGGPVTGKLSDVAGLIFVPLLCLAVLEIARASLRRPWLGSVSDVALCVASVAVLFVVAKASPTSAHAFGTVLGAVRFPARGTFSRVNITHDLSDLVALPALAIAYLDFSSAVRSRSGRTSGPKVEPLAP